ncbi:MAG TPA: SusD/RagB family nutrient-binding outer membrane lipoprotein [Chitinophagaceae bacterium]|nr:SusD/RagB family nutrient-binding outer membrane lipoprotein [Chitinophagaceae bacterium]
MKKIRLFYFLGIVSLVAPSCEKFLDVNDNPNAATSVVPELILPTAIVRSASLAVSYSTYGASLGGQIANAGGFSGFGSLLNYNFTPGTFSQWGTAYDNLNDYKYVIDNTDGSNDLALFNGVAKIMTALEYQRIVDQHGDVPYSEAVLGNQNLAPKYDDAATIYQDIVNKIDEGLSVINGATFPKTLNAASDPMFKGDISKWKQFANTLKLRFLIRLSGVSALSSFVSAKFAALEQNFLTDDAIVNPGYVKDRPNPTWATWGYTVTGNVANASRVPTFYTYGYYDGNKLIDAGRGAVIFNDFGNGSRPTPLNQLGIESGNPPIRANYSPWYTGNRASASDISNALGVVKGPSQGQPVILAAEAYFLLAEAQLKGYLPGDAKASFENGIRASFRYLYKNVTGAVEAGKDVNGDVAAYLTNNALSYLVNFDLATTDAQKLEAIITQKYIALNMITADESWNDYRRTGYPVTTPGGGKYVDMASVTSNSTRPDRLPTILKYPQSEYDYNPENVKDLNQFSDKLFWAK